MEIVAFSHLRWNFVYQRPQHLLSRFAKYCVVHYWEEPVFEEVASPELRLTIENGGVRVVTPVLPCSLSINERISAQRALLQDYLDKRPTANLVAWYYTPMALLFSSDARFSVIAYDCMDELSAFQGAPPELIELEQRLFNRADVVFTGGASLYASKRRQHPNVYLFPSSIDYPHFAAAQKLLTDPADQISIPHPRIGFYGVLDERLDRDLLKEVAESHPEWQFILLGPTAKISERDLPRSSNLHYLGKKTYVELPSYLANWDVAMMPFARNASTRYISPTKTPEYLAAHKPVVSTPIRDVVDPYGDLGIVRIAPDAESFGLAIQSALRPFEADWLHKVNSFLAQNSWDKTFNGMWKQIQQSLDNSHRTPLVADSRLRVGAHV